MFQWRLGIAKMDVTSSLVKSKAKDVLEEIIQRGHHQNRQNLPSGKSK